MDYLVDPATGCWVWQQSRNPGGYGLCRRDGVNNLAHRYYYEATHGPIPSGLELDHLCRNRLCVNVDHLQPVDRALNVQRGAQARLTPVAVVAIRALAVGPDALSIPALADLYGVSYDTIRSVVRGRTWKHHDPVSLKALVAHLRAQARADLRRARAYRLCREALLYSPTLFDVREV